MAFERIWLVPEPDAHVASATNIAAGLVAKKKLQGWHIAPDGFGITVDLYPRIGGVSDDFKGYDLYRTFILAEFRRVGLIERPAEAPLPVRPADRADSAEAGDKPAAGRAVAVEGVPAGDLGEESDHHESGSGDLHGHGEAKRRPGRPKKAVEG